jgi:uncharacterized membrane protein
MTGFVVLMDDEKVFASDMTLEEAGKMILSAGLVAPASYSGGRNDLKDQNNKLKKSPFEP